MPEISLTNSKGRDAQVVADSVRLPVRFRWLDADARQVANARLMKGTIDLDYEALIAKFGYDHVGQALVDGDPEIDLERTGSYLRDTSRVYFNTDRHIVHAVTVQEIVRNPDGSEKLRRPKKDAVPNVAPESPIRWAGKLMPKKDVFNKFVMVSKLQLFHVNGLTYDFLFEMAKELEAKNSLVRVGVGPKGTDRIVLRRGATPYIGFLEGRTRGDEYCLILHLSNIELKAPAKTEEKAS